MSWSVFCKIWSVFCTLHERIEHSFQTKLRTFVGCFGCFVPFENYFIHMEMPCTVERLQILTYTRHSWLLSSDCFLAYHTLCHKGHPFIMLSPMTVVFAPFAERVIVALSLPVLTTCVSRSWDSNTQPPACDGNALIDCDTAVAQALSNLIHLFSILRMIENET